MQRLSSGMEEGQFMLHKWGWNEYWVTLTERQIDWSGGISRAKWFRFQLQQLFIAATLSIPFDDASQSGDRLSWESRKMENIVMKIRLSREYLHQAGIFMGLSAHYLYIHLQCSGKLCDYGNCRAQWSDCLAVNPGNAIGRRAVGTIGKWNK